MRISIPASIEDATVQLGAVEQLLIARNWERAAIVAAFVQPQVTRGGDPATNATSRIGRISPSEFAALGIAGLRTPDTVRLYAQRWLDAHDGIHPEPGADVEIPDLDWPPQDRNLGGRPSVNPVRAVEQMIETHGADVVADAIATAAPAATRSAVIRNLPDAPLPTGTTVIPGESTIDATLDAQSTMRNLEAAIIRVKMHRDNHPGVWVDHAAEWSDRLRRMEAQVGILAAAVGGITDADMDALFASEGL